MNLITITYPQMVKFNCSLLTTSVAPSAMTENHAGLVTSFILPRRFRSRDWPNIVINSVIDWWLEYRFSRSQDCAISSFLLHISRSWWRLPSDSLWPLRAIPWQVRYCIALSCVRRPCRMCWGCCSWGCSCAAMVGLPRAIHLDSASLWVCEPSCDLKPF